MENNNVDLEKIIKEAQNKYDFRYMKGADEPMTKAQRHIIMGDRGKKRKSRVKEYGKENIIKFISVMFNIPEEEIVIEQLTKRQAQSIIVNFKSHKEGNK